MHAGSPEGPGPVRAATRQSREAHSRVLALGFLASATLHFALFVLAGLLSGGGGGGSLVPAEPRLVILPPAQSPAPAAPSVELPRPPEPIERPGEPVAVPEVEADAPDFTPHDVPPRLVNVEQVRKVLRTRFGSQVEEGESGETLVVLWLYVDRSGLVRRLQVRRSSGVEHLDRMAEQVGRVMQFRPALYKGRTVAVWVTQPIRFRAEAVSQAF